MNRVEILEFLKNHDDWVLQYNSGVSTLNGWWWLRNTKISAEVIDLNGNSARAASKSLKKLPRKNHKSMEFAIENRVEQAQG